MDLVRAERLPLEIDLALIARLDRNGPRSTSYPTADRFIEAFDSRTYASWAAGRNAGGAHRPLSIYVHLPCCSSLCYYCGCNKVITRDRNKGGEVVGINSMIYSATGGYMGLSFAVPIDVAMKVAAELRAHGRVSRGRLGLRMQDMTAELAASFGLKDMTGALVVAVEKNGPADDAGFREGDVVLSINDKTVTSSGEMLLIVAATRPGATAEFEVWRRGAKTRLAAVIGELGAQTDRYRQIAGGKPCGADRAHSDRAHGARASGARNGSCAAGSKCERPGRQGRNTAGRHDPRDQRREGRQDRGPQPRALRARTGQRGGPARSARREPCVRGRSSGWLAQAGVAPSTALCSTLEPLKDTPWI